jgi:glycerol-3-phosphate dehydrogenase
LSLSTEILVIGGGVTGCGVLFDMAQRGFRCLLVERGAFSGGTSGRMGGLLHSGARYAPRDPATARECIQENRILRRIVPHVIEDTGAMYVVTPWDPPDYADVFARACREAAIPIEEISPAAALRREPLLHPGLVRAFVVPAATVDTWAACRALVDSAAEYGAQTWPYHEVVGLRVEAGRVAGARVRDVLSGAETFVTCDLAINAAGAWGDRVARMAGCQVRLSLSKGTGLAMNSRLVHTAVIRCRTPSDVDGILPVGSVTVINSTSVPVSDADRYLLEAWEVGLILEQAQQAIPSLNRFRPLRAWAGVRPLYEETDAEERGKSSESPAGADQRQLSRDHTVLDHAARDGVEGFVTITGGKWTTYRLMAEQTVDLVCRKLGSERPCRTAATVLQRSPERRYYHLGERMNTLEQAHRPHEQVICECELVTRAQIEAYLDGSDRPILNDLRRELRLGMGSCQGGFCAYRAAGIMHEVNHLPAHQANKALVDFLQERWKGMLPVLWGQGLRQAALDEGIALGLLGLDKLPPALSGSMEPRLGELETEGYFDVTGREAETGDV